MECKKCGSVLYENEKFCRNCGEPVLDNLQNNYQQVNSNIMNNNIMNNGPIPNANGMNYNNPVYTNNIPNGNMQYNQNINPSKSAFKKFIIILGIMVGIVVALIAAFVLFFVFLFSSSSKLVCESPEGNITIMYNEKELTGYASKGITYDLDSQKEYANIIGVDAYIEEFEEWFATNTSGTCRVDD